MKFGKFGPNSLYGKVDVLPSESKMLNNLNYVATSAIAIAINTQGSHMNRDSLLRDT